MDRAAVRRDRASYYEEIGHSHMAPLWESLHNLVPKQPNPPAIPAIWKYADIRSLVLEAGSLITAKEAVRRVLILENPGGYRGRPASPRRSTPGCS